MSAPAPVRALVAGSDTLIGAGIAAELARRGVPLAAGGAQPELSDPAEVDRFFRSERPTHVYIAAGRSGGISANLRFPADLMLDNLESASHLLAAAHRHGVRKLLYLASSCSYPRECPQPMRPEHLLTGPLEPTNEAYAVGKIAGLVLCRAYRRQHGAPFISVIPANAFGPGDDFSPDDSHVIAALIRRMEEARRQGAPSVTVWGTGAAVRDFIFTEDLARGCLLAMERHEGEEPINVGSGEGTTIRTLAQEVRRATGFAGELLFDSSRPDGMPRKVLDISPIRRLGWSPTTPLSQAIDRTCAWYRAAHPPEPIRKGALP